MINLVMVEKVANDIKLSYGDHITKKALMELFGISVPVDLHNKTPNVIVKEYEDVNWQFLHAMESFKDFMRVNRKMHLQALRRKGIYRIIRPEEHADIALANLRNSINKGFKQCQDILEATRVDLLDQTERAHHTNVKVRTERLHQLFTNKSSLEKVKDEYLIN